MLRRPKPPSKEQKVFSLLATAYLNSSADGEDAFIKLPVGNDPDTAKVLTEWNVKKAKSGSDFYFRPSEIFTAGQIERIKGKRAEAQKTRLELDEIIKVLKY